MAITYSTTIANSRLTQVVNGIDGGAAAGQLVIGTSALAGATGILCRINLADPCGTVAAKVLTLSGVPKSGVASAAGTAAKAELRDSNDVVVASGLTVGTSGTDIIINSVTIASGQTVQINSGTITHP